MGYILFGILAFISFGSFSEGKKVYRRGLRLIFSLLVGVILTLVMESSMESLVAAKKIQGLPLYLLFHTMIPTAAFFIFQLLFYDIKMYGENHKAESGI